MTDARLARRHRVNIGTIVSDATVTVQYQGGARIGQVEESFIARLRPGDCFLFGGRALELLRVREMTAWVRRASGQRPMVPRWSGGSLPLSTALADAVLAQFQAAAQGQWDAPELQAVKPLLAVQARWSAVPTPGMWLAETLHTREGWHLFLYPFAGRHAHLGLASWLAWRMGQQQPCTVSMAVNDYGLELLSPTPLDWRAHLPRWLAAPAEADALQQEVLASVNATELAQRRFREIARIAGLLFQSHPREARRHRQWQASASLFWGVFSQHDPDNRLLAQARAEVLLHELEAPRLHATLQRLSQWPLQWQTLTRPSPLAFPLLAERLRERLSTETAAQRIARMVAQLERAADAPPRTRRRPA